MQAKFVVSHDGQEMGPYTEDEIKHMLVINQLHPIDYLYDEKKEDWILLTERFDLKAVANEMGLARPKENPVAPAMKTPYPELTETPPPQAFVIRRAASNPTSEPVGPVLNTTTNFASQFGMNPATPAKTTPVGSPAPLTHSMPMASQAPMPKETPKPMQTQTHTPMSQATTPQPSAPTAPSISKTEPYDASRIAFSGGVGVVNLTQLKAGKINLRLMECSEKSLHLPAEMVINVKAGPAKRIQFKSPSIARAGEDMTVEFTALDEYDNLASDFSGELDFEWGGAQVEKRVVKFTDGQAKSQFKPTRAEEITLKLGAGAHASLITPSPLKCEVKPGPAVSLLIEAPRDVVAGESLPLTVKAVDAFGNLATDFKGDIQVGFSLDGGSGKKAS